MRICVALCTCNGERYLAEQLASIAAQSRLPDHLLLLDDCSTDATPDIARRFASRADFPVDVRVNPHNLGYIRNFERAIQMADGDVIVLSDQDDLWSTERLARTEQAFASSPEAGMVFSDAELIDGEGRLLGERLWQAVGFTSTGQRLAAEGQLFEVLVRGSVVTGATLAFRSRFRDRLLPLVDGVTHDAWISLLLAALAPSVVIAEPLVMYRQHGENQIGARRLGPLQRLRRARGERLSGLEGRLLHHCAALERLQGSAVPAKRVERLRESIRHLEARVALPQRRPARLSPITQEVTAGRYGRVSGGLASAVRDFLA